jgi:hypothetical protein
MVNNVSKLLIDEVLDLDIDYELNENEISNLIPLFEHFEGARKKNIIKVVHESTTSRRETEIHLKSSKFTGLNVKEAITRDLEEAGVCVELQHPRGNIKICIFGDTQEQIQEYKKVIVDSIIFVLHCSLGDCKLKSINIFLTDLKKKVDREDIFDHNKKTSLSSDQVNTGVTYHYSHKSDIYLWRKEEIVKVCIHELIHSLDWDIRKSEKDIFSLFSKEFDISKNILLSEAYTEAWAEILNCYICAYLIEKDPKEIFCRFIHYLEIETIYSMWQVYKIIQLAGTDEKCSVDNFINITDKDTNVFPYYFLTTGILFNVADWTCLCENVCQNYVNFSVSKDNNKDMAEWFVNSITNKFFYDLCKKIGEKFEKRDKSKKIYETMRMSIVECV